ncbi:MAG: hypothetical protein B6D47_12955 [Rhodocyclaceae bacterium UTPRO2]|jgi:hypothetical protein|nr:MAG: hypothetical protein B6D47_12955 [Rhodocyclaceae bacterium UTPRO2]
MPKPNTAGHGTASEIAFMQSLSRRGRMSRLQVLQNYLAAIERRADWGTMDRAAVIRATEKEIEAEVREATRKAA